MVPRAARGCSQWASEGGAASSGGDLRPSRCAGCGWDGKYADASRRPGEDRLPCTVRECDCADHDELHRTISADDLLSLFMGIALRSRRSPRYFVGGTV